MKRVHFTDNYFINPTNPIVVNLIGAGGTGSQVLTALARINHALIELNHPGLQVNLWDSDNVSQANLGRQLFAEAELGLNKAVALINRVNRFFGTNWKARPTRYQRDEKGIKNKSANLIITCVDTVAARMEVAAMLKEINDPRRTNHERDKPYYWMDFGNSAKTGQVMLSTCKAIKQPDSEKYLPVDTMPFVTDEYADTLVESEDADNGPSCSLAEALMKQDLFINSTLANMGSGLLWNLFRQGMTSHKGFFLNLADFRSTPVSV